MIFALYLRFNLTTKPSWIDSFRKKYASRSILHITLVQPRYINEDQIQDVKDRIARVMEDFQFSIENKKVVFDAVDIEKEEDGNYMFMWFIQNNKLILDLQKKLVDALKDFNNYCDEVTRGYELNFRPHMTVADMIQDESEIKVLLSKDSKC